MTGRKIIPDEIKRLKGTAQPCRMRPNSPKIRDLVQLPEPHKSLKGEAKEIYLDTGQKLLQIGILNSVNLGTFVVYCFYLGLSLKYQSMLHEAEDIDSAGKIQRLYSDAVKNVRMMAVEFGITPSSAGKVTVPKKDEKSKLEQFLNK